MNKTPAALVKMSTAALRTMRRSHALEIESGQLQARDARILDRTVEQIDEILAARAV